MVAPDATPSAEVVRKSKEAKAVVLNKRTATTVGICGRSTSLAEGIALDVSTCRRFIITVDVLIEPALGIEVLAG